MQTEELITKVMEWSLIMGVVPCCQVMTLCLLYTSFIYYTCQLFLLTGDELSIKNMLNPRRPTKIPAKIVDSTGVS